MLGKLVIVVLILIGIASASQNTRSVPDETWWQTPNTTTIEKNIQDLNNSNWSIRKEAASELGHMNDTRVVEPLIQALNDKLPELRYTAAESLGYIGDKRAVEPLIQSINDRDHWVQYCAIEALGRIRDNRAVEPLIRYLEDKAKILPCHMYAGDEYIESRTVCIGANIDADNAIGALGKIGDPRAVDILIKILDKNSGRVGGYANGAPICAAADALADIGDPRAVEPLTQDYEWFQGWVDSKDWTDCIGEALKKLPTK